MEIKEVLTETPLISLPDPTWKGDVRVQELKLKIKAGNDKFMEADQQHKALNVLKAAASIDLGKMIIEAQDRLKPIKQFDAFLKDLKTEFGISRRMAYYHIDNARSGLDCATVAQSGFRGFQKHLRLKDALAGGGKDQTPKQKSGAKRLAEGRCIIKQALEVLSDVCAASLSNEEALHFDKDIAAFLKAIGAQWRTFRVTKGITA